MIFDPLTWPHDDQGRYLCTAEQPMPADRHPGVRWSHSDVEDIGPCPTGCCRRKRCRNCRDTWIGDNA